MQVAPEHPLWFEAALVSGQWLENVRLQIASGLVASIEPDVAPRAGDERGSVALPGLANLHSHAFQRGMSGLAETRGPTADSFWTWREIMYHFLDRMTPDDLEAITAQAYVEMLESGFTRVGEFHYVHHDCDGTPYANPGEVGERICGAAADTGIRLTLLPSFYAHGNFGGLEPTRGQRRFVTSLDEFGRLFQSAARSALLLSGATVGVAPHSLRAVTPNELRQVIAFCPNGPIHLHVAEQVQEVADCMAATGRRPVEWLLENLPVDERWCLIHATHVTPDEISGLARSGATVGLCPITEANLGDGIFPAVAFVAEGGRFGIGTDSNVNIGAAAELCMLEYSQRLAHRGRNVLAHQDGASSGRGLFEMARAGGNRALHGGAGDLAPGTPADIVALNCDYGELALRERGDALLDRLIFGGRRDMVDRVWTGGKRVVQDGRHLHREAVRARFRKTLRRLLSI